MRIPPAEPYPFRGMGFIKAAAITPSIRVGDCVNNAKAIAKYMQEAAAQEVSVAVFPELCLTGSTCGDLFFSPVLLQAAWESLCGLVQASRDMETLYAVGLPVQNGDGIYNACAVFQHGRLLAVIPQTTPQGDQKRWFSPAPDALPPLEMEGESVPMAPQLQFSCAKRGITLGVCIGSDAFFPTLLPEYGMQNVHLLLHPIAAKETVGQAAFLQETARSESARLLCASVWAGAGQGESTAQYAYAGRRILAECGRVLEQSPGFTAGMTVTDFDIGMLQAQRRKSARPQPLLPAVAVSLPFFPEQGIFHRRVSPHPFLPDTPEALAQRCEEILAIQTAALGQRLSYLAPCRPVLGLSGGLDSTLALLVCLRAVQRLGQPAEQILAVSMPCFGTTSRTKQNAARLAEELGVSFREISIAKAVHQHLEDIQHEPGTYGAVFENAQARERTQVLMDLANQVGGIVIGTGDLSELALGWATYNGDQMSMYGINSGVPKTLVRCLVEHIARQSPPAQKAILEDILDTPVSPELLPPSEGEIAQKTEELVGPYELHDFFLFHLVRHACPPEKIQFLAEQAFAGKYPKQTIQAWLKVFLRRFFSQQFKRSCMPDGPSIGSVSLSPLQGFQMPSDVYPDLWRPEEE